MRTETEEKEVEDKRRRNKHLPPWEQYLYTNFSKRQTPTHSQKQVITLETGGADIGETENQTVDLKKNPKQTPVKLTGRNDE